MINDEGLNEDWSDGDGDEGTEPKIIRERKQQNMVTKCTYRCICVYV